MHDRFDVHQVLIELVDVLLRRGIPEFLLLPGNDLLELQETVGILDRLNSAQVVYTPAGPIGILQLLLEQVRNILQVDEGELLRVAVLRDGEVYKAILDLIVEAMVIAINCALSTLGCGA